MYNGTMILEGGALRGVFTAGALDFLQEKEFFIQNVVGVSAGSGNGLNFVSRQKGRMLTCTLREGEDDGKLIDLKKAVKTRSLFDLELLYEEDPKEKHPFDFETFFRSPMTLEIVVTNCRTGEAEYLTEKEDADRLMKMARASSSMPLVSPMVEIDGVPYLDGGIADSIPLLYSMKRGTRKNVLILTRNYGYRKKESARSAAVYRAAFGKYPELVKSLCQRPAHYNRTLELAEKWETEGKIFVIRPRIPEISRMESNPENIRAFYRHGYEEMERRYKALLEFLER